MKLQPSRNIGLDLIRVTETAALAAGRWVGSGDFMSAHRAAVRAVAAALNTLDMDGRIVLGEEKRQGEESPLVTNSFVGTGNGPEVDVVVDPIDGTNLVVKGFPGAISLVCVAPRGTIWAPSSARYMEKIIVDADAAHVLVPECLDAPAAWTLALIARAKNKSVQDLTVTVLNRKRHKDLIKEIRSAGARVRLRNEGDAEGALTAVTLNSGVDVLMGIGGAPQGVIAACAAKALAGGMLARLAPQSDEEKAAIDEEGLDLNKVYTQNEFANSDQIFFAATGITDSYLLTEMEYFSNYARTHSVLIRSETGTRRFIVAEHGIRV